MMEERWVAVVLAAFLLPVAGVDSLAAEGEEDGSAGPVLVGALTREEIEAAHPEWMETLVAVDPDPAAAAALASLGAGATVTVYLGTWCYDSRRELARLWRRLDEIGGMPLFRIRYVGVDRDKRQPEDLLAGVDLRFVPTFVVSRAENEVGRVIEESPNGIEHDLAALLSGETSGPISTRQDLGRTPPQE